MRMAGTCSNLFRFSTLIDVALINVFTFILHVDTPIQTQNVIDKIFSRFN